MNDKVKVWIDEALVLTEDDKMVSIPQNINIPKQYCYKCDVETTWLAPDGRCGDCTGYTPEQIRGEV